MKSHPVRQWLFTVAAVGTLLWPVSLAAQATGQIAGAVTSETGQPLAGASISVPGTAIGTLTGANGRFTVSGVPAGQQSVRATLIGYTEQTQAVQVVAGQVATTNFQLASQALELEGVVAVGYGTQRRVNLTGAVASVNIEEAASM